MDARPTLRRDAFVAGLLALVLGAMWAWRDWAALSVLHLPDTDDVVRLQQIRDWLGGQAFADVSQHRLAGGLAMHWSRLPDLVPAALIALLTPRVGAHWAEVAAVTLWPPLLFAVALFLVARIARVLGAEPLVAAVLAAVAYPATTLFLPGRIDHHGLQMVLLLGAVLAHLRRGAGGGVVTGLLAAASLTIGLETAPLFAALGAIAAAQWVAGRPRAAEQLQGLGIGALVGLCAAKGIFATTDWSYPACDGFTGQAWRAAMALAPVPLVLALADPVLRGWRSRSAAALVVVAMGGAAAVLLSPGCLSPYGGVDPLMAQLWLAQVGEAQGLFAAPAATAIGYAGAMLVGLGCALWQWRATRDWRWATLVACQVTTLLVTFDALRGAYAGALLAAPALAAAIAGERARGMLRLAGAWLLSAGMLWPLAAGAVTSDPPGAATGRGECAGPAMIAALNALPVGTVIAPVDAGAYLLGATHDRLIAAPYHRNGAGNRAAYGFYLGDAQQAGTIARAWHVDYALACASMPGPIRAAPLPGWRRLATLDDGSVIYAPGLSPAVRRR